MTDCLTARVISIVSVALVLIATRSASAQRLEETVIGTWEFDSEATEKLHDDDVFVAVALSLFGNSFEFKRDGRLIMRIIDFPASTEESKWKVIKVDEARKELTIEAEVPDPGKVTVTMTKEGMVWRIEEEGLSVVLARTKGK